MFVVNTRNQHLPPAGQNRTGRLAVAPLASEPEPSAGAPADRLIGIRDIQALFGLGRTAAYELTHRPGFPDPVRLSPRCYRWWAAQVTAFAADLRQQPRPGDRAIRRPRTEPHPEVPALRITGKVRMTRSRKRTS
jgi:predicted DNA-binding transcriptional regulator AlpA